MSTAHLLRHLAPDQDAVRSPAEMLEHRQLVVDLRAARDDDERMRNVTEKTSEVLDLGEEQEACVGGQEPARRLPSSSGHDEPNRTRR